MDNLYVVKAFTHLHDIPEIANCEFKTSKFIYNSLKEMNILVKNDFAGTAVIAEMDSGKPGPCLVLRADMDALEFVIDGKKKMIHACGHDANSSMVLAAAKEISKYDLKHGKLKFLFQPAEETGTGADLVCKSGALNDATHMVGIHFRSNEDILLGQATPALTHGATGSMEFRVKGQPAHGSRPHLGVNAVEAVVLAANAVNTIRVDSRVPFSAKVTNIQTDGYTANIIPEYANFKLDIRAQVNPVMEDLVEKIKKAVFSSVESIGAQADLLKCSWRPAAEFDDEMIGVAKDAIEEVLGQSLPQIYTPGGEDFHIYKRHLGVKSAYIGLGANLSPGLHKPEMSFDRKALEIGQDILVEIVKQKIGLITDQ